LISITSPIWKIAARSFFWSQLAFESEIDKKTWSSELACTYCGCCAYISSIDMKRYMKWDLQSIWPEEQSLVIASCSFSPCSRGFFASPFTNHLFPRKPCPKMFIEKMFQFFYMHNVESCVFYILIKPISRLKSYNS
jgi:hypothetical protein